MKGLIKALFLTLFLILLLFFSSNQTNAFSYTSSFQLDQDLTYSQHENWRGITTVNLDLNSYLGFDKRFYVNPVLELSLQENEGTDFDLRLEEAFFDLYLQNFDLRAGKQIISWGSGYQINPTSQVNPLDYTAENPLEAEIGVESLLVDYHPSFETSISAVAVLNYRPSKMPEGVMEGAIINSFPQVVAVETFEPEIDSPGNAEYALKYTRRNLGAFDLGLSYYRGYADLPAISSEELIRFFTDPPPVTARLEYFQKQSLGLDLVGSLGDYGLWIESSYSWNEEDERIRELVLGSDQTLENEMYVVLQLYHRSYHRSNENQILEEEDQNLLLLYAEQPHLRIHTLSCALLYDLDLKDYLLNPELKFSLKDDLSMKTGALFSKSSLASNSWLQNMGEERLYLGLSYYF